MARRVAAGILLAGLVCAPTAQADGATASGVGARRCSAFGAALERDSAAALDAYVSWSQGFIAGFNWSNVRQRNVSIDAAAIINWLGQYCAARPTALVFDAVQELIRRNAR